MGCIYAGGGGGLDLLPLYLSDPPTRPLLHDSMGKYFTGQSANTDPSSGRPRFRVWQKLSSLNEAADFSSIPPEGSGGFIGKSRDCAGFLQWDLIFLKSQEAVLCSSYLHLSQ